MKPIFLTKARCNICNDIVVAESDITPIFCSCGDLKVLGQTYKRIQGSNYTDLSELIIENLPPYRGAEEK